MTMPERTREQRMQALGRANCTRTARAHLKDDLKHGVTQAGDVLEDPPEYVQKMKVLDLLLAVPRLGMVKANKLLGECQVAPSKTIGGLSPRQRRQLQVCLRRAHVGVNRRDLQTRGVIS